MKSNFLKNFFDILLSPFNINLRYLIGWLILILPASIFYLTIGGIPSYGRFILYWSFISIYLLTFLIGVVNQRYVRLIYIIIITTYLLFFSIADIFCLTSFKFSFGLNEVALIAGTNKYEVENMLSMYLGLKFALWAIIVLGFSLFAFYLIKKHPLNLNYVGLILLMILSFFVPKGLKHLDAMTQSPIFKPLVMAFRLEKMPTIEQMTTIPNLTEITDSLRDNFPKKVVLIIGESFNRNHSSLYGYEKKTNPILEGLRDKGNLCVYNNVKSADTRTVEAIKKMLSIYNGDNDKKWYECDNLPVIMRNADIRTRWFSNQEEYGIYDNAVSCYAHLCDTYEYTQGNGNKYDELILSLLDSQSDSIPTIDIIHLMGSHESFRQRYPDNFDHFKSSDYPGKSTYQREQLSAYDNSILYNDYIVSEIIKRYQFEDAIIIITSDHGLDIFDSSEDYVGHARHLSSISEKAASEVPFFIYMSDIYLHKHPKTIEMDKEYNLSNLIYTIMDIYNLKFKTNIHD